MCIAIVKRLIPIGFGTALPLFLAFHSYRAAIVVGILEVQFKGTYRRALDGIAIGTSIGRVGFIFVNSLWPLCLPRASGIGPPIVRAWAPVDDYVDY